MVSKKISGTPEAKSTRRRTFTRAGDIYWWGGRPTAVCHRRGIFPPTGSSCPRGPYEVAEQRTSGRAMAKKPIPGMQETALSSLANQFPGSRGRGGGDPASGAAADSDSAGFAGTPPAPVSNVFVRRGASGWVLALAVLICLAAATVSLSAPSLRPVVRDLFVDYAPAVPQRYVDFLVGQSGTLVEVDLAALDSRVEGLRGAINAVTDGAAADSEEMKQFLVGALTFGTARRLEEQLTRLESDLTAFQKQNEAKSGKADETYAAIITQLTALESAAAEARNVLAARLDSATESDIALDGRLAVAEAQSARSTSSLTAVDERLAAIDERFTAADERLGAIDERLSGVRDATAPIAGRVDAAEAKITTQEAKITTQEAKITTQEGAIAAQIAAVEDLKSTVGSLTQARIERIQPLLLILGLNNAVTANRSYKASLDAAAEALVSVSAALGDATAATAIATLRRHEGDSIPTRDQITRDFGAISQSVLLEQEPSRIESLRVSIVALVEAALDKPTSAVSEQDRIKSMLRTIGAELSGGRLGEALTKAESLDHPKFRTKLNAWRAQARARLEVDAAVEALEAMAFKYLSAER